MDEVYALGIGQTVFGKLPDQSAHQLGQEAAGAAITDSGIDPRRLQVAYASRSIGATTDCQKILMAHGVRGIEMFNTHNACAGGSSAIRSLWKDIASGMFDVGIAIGVENINSTSAASGPLQASQDLDSDMGLSMPVLFANIARRQMDALGATAEDFALISAKNHKHAVHNPFAQYRKELTVEEILNSRMISDPITLLQCCPNTDGGAAVILCSRKFARQYTTNLIRISGSALVSGDYAHEQGHLARFKFGERATQLAYEMAGINPTDINVVEHHDAFANEELLRYEDLQLCGPGESVALLRSGATQLGGRVPVNPSGGLLSLGHPLSASGVRVIVDVVRQLRGDAGAAQVPSAKLAVAHMMGGVVTGLTGGAAGVHVVQR